MRNLAQAELHSSAPPSWNWAGPLSSASLLLRCDANTGVAVLSSPAGVLRTWDQPLAALSWMAGEGAEENSRWVGSLSYDLGRLFEEIPSTAPDPLRLPLFCFARHSAEVCAVPQRATYETSAAPLRSTFSQLEFERAVKRIIDYIAAGDVFQVNLSQRYSVGLPCQPFQIWERLKERWPAWYGAYLDFGDYALISNSPELFLRVERDPRIRWRRVVTRPIKGTRPRLPGMEAELQHSLKDQAELNMIVDLERNDLGRVCEIGTVHVVQPREIEAHPTVYHGVATIEGTLRDDVSFVDLLRATFPGGSVTGAPKIRAMQIIEELEPVRRGPYCGAIGTIAADGSMQFNLAIRTMIVKDGLVHIPVGGGIVADSDPAAEYEETLVKAQAMFGALGIS